MVAELITETKRQWRANWGAKWGGMCPSSRGEYGKGLCPSPTPTPEIVLGIFMMVSEWYDLRSLPWSTQQEADTRVMLHAIYSVHNEGVDHDNDTDNYHRHMSLTSFWTVCTHAFDCQLPWMTWNWPPVTLMRSVTLHMCSESTTKISMKVDPHY